MGGLTLASPVCTVPTPMQCTEDLASSEDPKASLHHAAQSLRMHLHSNGFATHLSFPYSNRCSESHMELYVHKDTAVTGSTLRAGTNGEAEATDVLLDAQIKAKQLPPPPFKSMVKGTSA